MSVQKEKQEIEPTGKVCPILSINSEALVGCLGRACELYVTSPGLTINVTKDGYGETEKNKHGKCGLVK